MKLGTVVNSSGRPPSIQTILCKGTCKSQIFTVIIIALISIFSYDVFSGIEDVFRNYIFSPKYDPIFCDLAKSTTTLIEDLVKFNIPASIDVMELRTTSNFLSGIISRSQTSTSSSPSLYLQSLGDKAYITGIEIEKLYSAGSFTLDELSKELQDTRQHLQTSNDSLFTAQYCLARFNQIQFLVTRFRGRFVEIEKIVQEIQKLYNGYDNVQGFSNIINHFEENVSTYEQIYDMKIVQQELDSEKEKIEKLLIVGSELKRVGEGLDSFNKKLDSFKERIGSLSDKKIATQKDDQALEEVIYTINSAKETWHKMDKVDNNFLLGS